MVLFITNLQPVVLTAQLQISSGSRLLPTKQNLKVKNTPCNIECVCRASVDVDVVINLCRSFVERVNGNLTGTGFSFWPNCVLFVTLCFWLLCTHRQQVVGQAHSDTTIFLMVQ
jgi:hypothetical protein